MGFGQLGAGRGRRGRVRRRDEDAVGGAQTQNPNPFQHHAYEATQTLYAWYPTTTTNTVRPLFPSILPIHHPSLCSRRTYVRANKFQCTRAGCTHDVERDVALVLSGLSHPSRLASGRLVSNGTRAFNEVAGRRGTRTRAHSLILIRIRARRR